MEKIGEAVQPLANVVQDYIREKIVSGEYPPGYRLKERDLSEETGVSRIPIREALRALQLEKLVVIFPRRGAVVAEISAQFLDDFFEVRTALEVLECRLAAQNATDEDISDLEDAVVSAREAHARKDKVAFDQANTDFHAILVRSAHNDVLCELLDPLRNRMNWVLRQNEEVATVNDQHASLVEAIKDRDVARAEKLAQEHVETSKQLAIKLIFPTK